MFTLLSLALPAETVRLAFHGLHTGDRHLRGTAIEYLETVLPAPVWSRLWPFLDEGEEVARGRIKTSEEAMQELMASQQSIDLALAQRGIHVHFEEKCLEVDLETPEVTFQSLRTDEVVMPDGAGKPRLGR